MAEINIAVVGAGISGLCTAVNVQNEIKNAKVTIYAEKFGKDTTSSIAAGLWTPYLTKTVSSNVIKWSQDTYKFFLQMWKKGFAGKIGFCFLPVTIVTSIDQGFKDTVKWSRIPLYFYNLTENEINIISKEHGKQYKCGITFFTFTCDTMKVLTYFSNQFLQNGGKLKTKKITSLEELNDYDVVINCAGLGSQELVNDDKVVAIRGQVTRVEAPWRFSCFLDNDGFYFIPTPVQATLGFTEQYGDTDLNVRKTDYEHIKSGCHKICPALKDAKEIITLVGLRPGRTDVRLEKEFIVSGNKILPVIHNYGHGGTGYTFSVGCAIHATRLVQEVFQQLQSKL